MKQVTVEDCLELQKLFEKYFETAEQHEFIKLILIQSRIDKYISRLHHIGKIKTKIWQTLCSGSYLEQSEKISVIMRRSEMFNGTNE